MNQGAVSIMQFHFSVVIGSQLVASAMSPVGTFRTWPLWSAMSDHRGWSQPVDATLYLKGEMECALMGKRFHRFTAAEKAELKRTRPRCVVTSGNDGSPRSFRQR